ncbi:MAG: ABC transporter permease subunit, partial [Planctomycetota bacterium]|nr:ABC transporter permease subunit [Planctomycetota bacterium]
MPRGLARGIFATTSLLLGVLFLVPLWMVLQGGFYDADGFTLRHLIGVLTDPVYAGGLRNSVLIALGVTLLASAIAVPLAWIADRYDFAGKRWFTGLVLVPMILPPFLGAVGWQQLFGQYGAVNAWFGIGHDWLGSSGLGGVILLEALALYPIIYLNASAALANLDPALAEAASNLGCTGLRKFRRITLPLIAPGLFAGGILVFIWSFTELGTPLMLNYTRCAPVQVFDALKEIGSDPTPYALVAVLLIASVVL